MQTLNIPVILGTGHEGRGTEAIARFVHEQATQYGFDSQFVDVRQFATPVTVNRDSDDTVQRWRTIVAAADGFIIVTPEYNHSFPGELKILLDKAYDEYNRKVVGVCTVSNGPLGGTRVAESLLPVFNTLKLMPLRDATYFTSSDDLFEGDHQLTTAAKKTYALRLETQFSELAWYGAALKTAREQSLI